MRRTSVVIPCYQHARFVAEAIRSVAGQAVELELIVVDDGSRDGSADVVRRTFDELQLRGARLIEQENRGAHAAIARGVEATTGDVVTILNSDDRFHAERLARIAAECPERGDFLAFSGVRMIDAVGDELSDSSSAVLGYRHALYEATRCPTVGFALLRNNIAVTSGNLVFTRALYDKLGGFASYRLAHDWDFLLRALLHVEPIFVAEPLLDYRAHDHNTKSRLDDVVEVEGRAIWNRYLTASRSARPTNSLAPCEENWPVYFDLFTSRYHAWFARGPLRDWMDDELAVPSSESAWRSWADAVDFERVDDSDYLVDPNLPRARRVALALARDVLIGKSHPLVVEEGAGEEALYEVYARQARPVPRFRRAPWASPIGRGLARPSPPERARTIGRASLRQRLKDSAVGELVRSLEQWWFVRRSGSFDGVHYREQCRKRGLRVLSPIAHYLRAGERLRLNPHPFFDTGYYLRRNPDVDGRTNALVHYLRFGVREGRRPHPGFDPTAHPDLAGRESNAFVRFVSHGNRAGSARESRFGLRRRPEDSMRAVGDGAWENYRERTRRGGLVGNPPAPVHVPLWRAVDSESIELRDRGRDARRIRALRQSGLFDADYYQHCWGSELEEHEDAVRHFLERGTLEGVGFCPRPRIEARLEELETRFDDPDRPELSYLIDQAARPPTAEGHQVTLYVSSQGNAFFNEMAALLAHGFDRIGADVRIVDERGAESDRSPQPNEHEIVLAPHEFFLLGDGSRHVSPEFLGRCSLWFAEQPGSEYFAMGIWFAHHARRVLDVNPLSALAWGALGFEARAFPLGWIDDFEPFADGLGIRNEHVRAALLPEARRPTRVDAPWSERPIDIFFNGVLTEHRERFFARNGWLFSDLRCTIFMPTPSVPISAQIASSLDVNDATALSQRSKILLNIHRSETNYFEWHRVVVRGIWQKSLVVSEPSTRVPGLEPGEHYVECELEEMPRRIEWLLHSPEGQAEAERIRHRAFDALRRRYPLERIASCFLVEDAASEGSV